MNKHLGRTIDLNYKPKNKLTPYTIIIGTILIYFLAGIAGAL